MTLPARNFLIIVQPARKKSKAEVMAEVMAKSKEHKVGFQLDIGLHLK